MWLRYNELRPASDELKSIELQTKGYIENPVIKAMTIAERMEYEEERAYRTMKNLGEGKNE